MSSKGTLEYGINDGGMARLGFTSLNREGFHSDKRGRIEAFTMVDATDCPDGGIVLFTSRNY